MKSEKILKKYTKKFEKFTNDELGNKLDPECLLKVQELFESLVEYWLQTANEIVDMYTEEMVKKINELRTEHPRELYGAYNGALDDVMEILK